MDNELKDILNLINKVEVLNAKVNQEQNKKPKIDKLEAIAERLTSRLYEKVMADETLTPSEITLFGILINRK